MERGKSAQKESEKEVTKRLIKWKTFLKSGCEEKASRVMKKNMEIKNMCFVQMRNDDLSEI